MKNRRCDTELSQQAHAADAEYLFLNDTGLDVAAVKVARDEPVNDAVGLYISVEQVKVYASDLSKPRLGNDLTAAYVNTNCYTLTMLVRDRSNSHLRLKNVVIGLFLPAVV